MSAKRNEPNRDRSTSRPGNNPPARIPDAPPMQDRKLPWWPLVAVLAAFAGWLIFLAILAMNSERWLPG